MVSASGDTFNIGQSLDLLKAIAIDTTAMTQRSIFALASTKHTAKLIQKKRMVPPTRNSHNTIGDKLRKNRHQSIALLAGIIVPQLPLAIVPEPIDPIIYLYNPMPLTQFDLIA